MTTIVATRKAIYADTLCSYTVPFKMGKIARIGKSIFAGAGDPDELTQFFDWRRGKKKPVIEDAIDVLEVAPGGIYVYGKKLVRLKINEEIYAVGSGAQYAMGAIAMGATPEQSIEVASRYDSSTRLPIDLMNL